jgi:uncharacterized protein YidB (DUF937 family)
LLDSVLGGVTGGAPQRPGLGSTVAAGVVLALVVKAVRNYEASHAGAAAPGEGRSFDPQQGQAPQGAGGGLGGMLGGLMGAGGLSGVLNNLGGAGALGALVSHLQQNGLGQQAGSWVGTGANQPVAPQQLASALGEDAIQTLQNQNGMGREALLGELSHVLPQAVDEATPEGRLPNDQDLHQIARPGGEPSS